MANVNIPSGGWRANELWPSPPMFDSYYEAHAEQRHILEDLIGFSNGWYWHRPSNAMFQSQETYQNVTYMVSDPNGKPLRYRRKSDRLSRTDKVALAFCFMRF